MLDTIRKTADFLCNETNTDRIISSAESLYGLIGGKLSPDLGIKTLSEITVTELVIRENVPNRATAFIVSAASELHKNAVKCDIPALKELTEILRDLPEKRLFGDKTSRSEFNLTIAEYNSAHNAKLSYIV